MEQVKKKRIDVMVDIETLSTDREKGLILSVAAVPFNLTGEGIDYTEKFSYSVSVFSSLMYGRKIDDGTVEWWRSRPEDVRDDLEEEMEGAVDMAIAFGELWVYLDNLKNNHDLHVWSKGIDFDFPMIESTWRSLGYDGVPYYYNYKKDVRTILDLAKRLGWTNPQKKEDIKHSALEDCKDQIGLLLSAEKWIRGGR